MGDLVPAAFMSYAHVDDEYGHISEFKKRLQHAISTKLGESFNIFQDCNDIQWGENWRGRIDESLNSVTFLIAIITPSFLKSSHCRDEVKKFLERERMLERNDLILPVYYIGSPLIDDDEKCAGDEITQIISSHQYVDWRELMFEPYTNPQVGKMLANLASQVVKALERTGPPRGEEAVPGSSSESPSEGQHTQGQAETKSSPATRTEPPTRVVDPWHRGDHATISEAIRAARPGDRILVRPGFYEEGLIVDKPLDIIGDGNLSDITIKAVGKSALLFRTSMGRVSNLTLRQAGGGTWYGVDISQGRLELEGCDISSQGSACVAIHGGADPRLRRNKIHDGIAGGVFVYENSQGLLEDNDIFNNAFAGVEIKEGGNPTIRRNKIHDGKQSGVHVFENGQGLLEDNDVFGNAFAGIEIKEGGNPTLRRNKIHDGKAGGVYVWNNGQGLLEDNDIFGNALAGIEIKEGGNPTLRRNKIHDGKTGGIYVWNNGQGLLEDNDIFGNVLTGVEIKEGGSPTFRRNRINKNDYGVIYVHGKGAGTFEDNDLRDNKMGAWDISEDSLPLVKRSNNLE